MEVQKIATSRAVRMLVAAGCKFKVIEADGTEHGELAVMPEPKPRTRQPGKYPHGTYLAYFKPIVDSIKPDGASVVPYGQFQSPDDRESLRGSICGYLTRVWGHQSYITHCNDQGVEVLRMS